MTGLRVLLLSSNDKGSREIITMLKQMGCIVVGKATDQITALRLISVTQPDLVIMDNHKIFPQAVTVLTEDKPTPMVIIAQQGYIKQTPQSLAQLDCGYLEKPISRYALEISIKIELERFNRIMELRKVQNELNKPNTTRRLVTEASEIIAHKSGINKMQALCKLQVLSLEKHLSLRDVAQEILLTAAAN